MIHLELLRKKQKMDDFKSILKPSAPGNFEHIPEFLCKEILVTDPSLCGLTELVNSRTTTKPITVESALKMGKFMIENIDLRDNSDLGVLETVVEIIDSTINRQSFTLFFNWWLEQISMYHGKISVKVYLNFIRNDEFIQIWKKYEGYSERYKMFKSAISVIGLKSG